MKLWIEELKAFNYNINEQKVIVKNWNPLIIILNINEQKGVV